MMQFGYGRRIGYLALSGCAGWFASQIATLPSHLLTAVRLSEGEQRLFLQSIGLGLLAWGGWTMVLAFAGALFVALPLVLAVHPERMVRYRKSIFCVAAVAAIAISYWELRDFRDPTVATRFRRWFEVLPYGVFAVVFAVVTAWTYIFLAKRRLQAVNAAARHSRPA